MPVFLCDNAGSTCDSHIHIHIYIYIYIYIYIHQHCTDEAQKAETVLSAVSYIYIYIYIYIYTCRQYCFGLLGLISAVLMSGMEVKLINPPKCPTHVVHLSHARVLKLAS